MEERDGEVKAASEKKEEIKRGAINRRGRK